jgi:hypothetical protein
VIASNQDLVVMGLCFKPFSKGFKGFHAAGAEAVAGVNKNITVWQWRKRLMEPVRV